MIYENKSKINQDEIFALSERFVNEITGLSDREYEIINEAMSLLSSVIK